MVAADRPRSASLRSRALEPSGRRVVNRVKLRAMLLPAQGRARMSSTVNQESPTRCLISTRSMDHNQPRWIDWSEAWLPDTPVPAVSGRLPKPRLVSQRSCVSPKRKGLSRSARDGPSLLFQQEIGTPRSRSGGPWGNGWSTTCHAEQISRFPGIGSQGEGFRSRPGVSSRPGFPDCLLLGAFADRRSSPNGAPTGSLGAKSR